MTVDHVRPPSLPPDVKIMDADDLYREQVEEARKMSVGERLIAGIELFDLACEFAKMGIRMQHPGASEEEVLDILEARLDLGRRLELD